MDRFPWSIFLSPKLSQQRTLEEQCRRKEFSSCYWLLHSGSVMCGQDHHMEPSHIPRTGRPLVILHLQPGLVKTILRPGWYGNHCAKGTCPFWHPADPKTCLARSLEGFYPVIRPSVLHDAGCGLPVPCLHSRPASCSRACKLTDFSAIQWAERQRGSPSKLVLFGVLSLSPCSLL